MFPLHTMFTSLMFFVSILSTNAFKTSNSFKAQVSTDTDKTTQCFPIRTTNKHARQFFNQIGQVVRNQQSTVSSLRGVSSKNVFQLIIDVASCACAKTSTVKVNQFKQLVLMESVMRGRSQRKLGKLLANNVDACVDYKTNAAKWQKMFWGVSAGIWRFEDFFGVIRW